MNWKKPKGGGKVHILLAEDNPFNRKLAKLVLEKAGYMVEDAEDGKQTLEKYTSNPNEYDLIFMDIQMPVMDGFLAARAIRTWEGENSRGKDKIPIIAMTAFDMEVKKDDFNRSGMDDYINKPLKHEEIISVIRKWAGTGQKK